MREYRDIPQDLLSISRYRRTTPLPYPSPEQISDAIRNGLSAFVVAREHPDKPGRYEILRGVEVWLLAQRAGIENVPAMVTTVADDTAKAMVAAEASGNPIDTAETIQSLMEDNGWSIAEAGRYLNIPRSTASHLLRLLKLGTVAKEGVRGGSISVKHAKLLLRLTPAKQSRIAEKIQKESLSSRAVARLIGAAEKDEPENTVASQKWTPSREKDPDTLRLEKELGGILGTRVDIDYRAEGGGQLVIDFHNLDGLDGILEQLGYRAY